jgi:restriction system protein
LVLIFDDAAAYELCCAYIAAQPPAWLNLPKSALWHVGENDAGSISMKSLGRANTEINELLR